MHDVPGAHNSRHHRRQRAINLHAIRESLRRRALRSGTGRIEADRASSLGLVEQQEAIAADRGRLTDRHGQCRGARDHRIDDAAAALEHRNAGQRGGGVAGDKHGVPPIDRRPRAESLVDSH